MMLAAINGLDLHYEVAGSGPPLTVAVLVMVLPAARDGLDLTTIVNVAVAPLAKPPAPIVAVTVPELAPAAGVVHVHPIAHVKDTKVVFAGRLSVSFAVVDAFGPLLCTVIV